MENLTAVIPFRDGHAALGALLDSLPAGMPVVVVDDASPTPLRLDRPHVRVIRLERRGYFAGAVNAGLDACATDVLVLNQDVTLQGEAWLDLLAEKRTDYALIGGAQMRHPHWPAGYVQGQFMFMRRDALEAVGPLNARDYPLWGCTCEWQLRAVRRGFKFYPLAEVPGLAHARPKGEAFGASIRQLLEERPDDRDWFIRTPPAISVIVTSYAYGRYLTDCVNSLVGGPTCLGAHPGQTFQSFEIVIVDDASTDETAEVGQALADDAKAIRYIRRGRRGGTPAANNTGIAAARGRYFTILCGDDMREPWSLEELYRVVEANPRAVAYDDITVIANGQRRDPWPMATYDFDRLLTKNMMHAGIMASVAAWREVGGYPEVMDQGREDWAMNIRLGANGYCGVHVPRPGYLYRREGQNRSLTNQGQEWRAFFTDQLRRLFPDLYAGVRPMGCCGGSQVSKVSVKSNGQNGNGVQADALGAGGMTLLNYLGGNTASEPWYGPVTGARYLFGGKRQQGYVDNRDVPGLLNVMRGRKPVFELAEEPAPQGAPMVGAGGVAVTAVANMAAPNVSAAAAKDESALDTPVTDFDGVIMPGTPGLPAADPGAAESAEPPAHLSYPIETAPGEFVEGDPRELTVGAVRDLVGSGALARAQLERMLAMEEAAGRPRKGVLDALKGALDA